jgi:hypothetical protein
MMTRWQCCGEYGMMTGRLYVTSFMAAVRYPGSSPGKDQHECMLTPPGAKGDP